MIKWKHVIFDSGNDMHHWEDYNRQFSIANMPGTALHLLLDNINNQAHRHYNIDDAKNHAEKILAAEKQRVENLSENALENLIGTM